LNGNLVGGFNIPNRKVANGVWGVNEVANYTKQQMWPTANDPSWSSVQFLMHGDAVLNTGNPLDVTGTSDCQWVVASSANPAGSIRSSPFFPYGTSFRVASINGAIKATHLTGSWAIGTQDFTIDFLCYITTASAPTALDMRGSGGPQFLPLMGWDNGTGKFYYFTNGSTRISAGAWSLNTPYLVTYNRTASTGTLFVNGTSVGTWADSSNYVSTTAIWPIGTIGPPGPSLDYMDEIRITIGVARNPSTYFNTTTRPLLQRFPDH
jgi:hypothetical protein